MRKKNVLLVLAAALLTVSCGTDLLDGSDGSTPQLGPNGELPVSFSAYTSRTTTRGGVAGTMENAALKSTTTDIGKAGFGVFAYYTDAEDYASHSTPNFMFNQQVKYNAAGVFDYSPVRYWPNEYGTTAKSEDIDKVSFFAYAPYVAVKANTGYLSEPGEQGDSTTWGITGTSRNTYNGDPLVKYATAFDIDKCVDLCWGVYNEGASGWATMNGKQTTTDGLPWLNVEHAQSVDQRLPFTFRHALSKLNVQIDTEVDGTAGNALGTHYGVGTADAEGTTKVYVRSVSLTGIATHAALNLNNVEPNVPLWMNYNGTGWIESGQTVTVHDGLRDGWEGTGATASTETVTGLNPAVTSNEGNTTAGVTATAVNLFGRSSGTPQLTDGVLVIPTGERVSLTIVYDVETRVADLPGVLSDGVTHGTSVENRITQAIKVGSTPLAFEGGKAYTLKLHLGMNSVKFSAEVTDEWGTGATVSIPHVLTISLDPSASTTYTADGNPHGPGSGDITVKDEDGNTLSLTEGTDYDITYSGTLNDGTSYGPSSEKPTYPGSYNMTLTGKGDYQGSVATQPFTITPKDFNVGNTKPKMNATDLDAISVTDATSGSPLTKNSDYTIVYTGTSPAYGPSTTKPTTPGTYTWTVKGCATSLYGCVEKSGTFTLLPSGISVSMKNGQTSPTYQSDGINGKGPGSSDINIKDNSGNPLSLSEGTDYDITYSGTLTDGTTYGPSSEKPKYPGTYTMTLTGKGDYDGLSATQPFTLTGEAITVSGITSGATVTPSTLTGVTVKGATSGTTLPSSQYTITYEGVSPTSYGPSTTKPSGSGTYKMTVKPIAESKYGGADPVVIPFTLDSSAHSGASTGNWTSGGSSLGVTKK